MDIDSIKTPEDVLSFMNNNIKYGWIDVCGEEHIGNMKDFRRLYRTSSIEETLNHKIGTCIEQVNLMSMLLDKLGVPNKMYCTRIYENEDFNDLDEDEHMHCFLLYFIDGKTFQLEHPNPERVGIHEYESEEKAIDEINKYYVNMSGGYPRPVTEFYEVPVGLTFKEFNIYINNLDSKKIV